MVRPASSRALSVAAAATALSLSACSAGHTVVPSYDNRATPGLTLASTLSFSSLDFANVGGVAIPGALMHNVYETLVNIDPDSGEPAPGLATSWETSADGKTYTFHLREGVRFSNGDAFSAHTAAYSIDQVRNEWTNGLAKGMDIVDSARAIDDHTLEVTLRAPSRSWLWSLSTLIGAQMTPAAHGEVIGTGPFTVGDFAPGEYLRLAARPAADYWSEPAHQDVTIKFFPDSTSSVNALRTHQADIVWGLQDTELLADLPADYPVQTGSTTGELVVSMNNAAAPFDDPRARRAVAYAVDRQAANSIVWDGHGTDTGGAPVPPSDPWFTGKDYYPYDPAKAKQLLADAGATGAPITIKVPTRAYTQTIAEFLYSQLTAVGFDVTLESTEFPAVWLADVMGAHDYQASVISHAEPRDITTLFGNPDYYLGYDSPRTRELLAQADRATNPAESNRLMEQAVDQIMADAAALTVMNVPNIVVTRPGVDGVHPDAVTDGMDLTDLRGADA